MIKRPNTNAQRLKRHKRVRAKISGTPEMPRLNVFRSEANIYAQVIDDVAGVTLVSASSLDKSIDGYGGNIAAATEVGKLVAERCKAKGIQLLYHNHDFEFVTVSNEYGLDFLYEAIEPEFLKTELDMCWVKYAGYDPCKYLETYAGRYKVVHLKDFTCNELAVNDLDAGVQVQQIAHQGNRVAAASAGPEIVQIFGNETHLGLQGNFIQEKLAGRALSLIVSLRCFVS